MQEVFFKDLGEIAYKQAWDYQEELLQKNISAKSHAVAAKSKTIEEAAIDAIIETPTSHHFLLCEHPPVYTLGKSGKSAHILISEDERIKKGIEYYPTNRGGDITFHGPGQIVGYPVLDLEKYYTDIGKYLRNLEEVIIVTLAAFGIKGERSQGETGVWIDPDIKGKERKICAMGVRCSRWVTMHGFALNVNTNLDYFNYIVPCGIQNKQVTSLARELGFKANMEEVKRILKENFEKVFDCTLISV